MPDEVRSIVDAMAARLAANVALLTSSASWISATGYVTPAAIADVVWLSRDRHSHLTVTSPAVRSASRRKATTP
jgi:hypothetical protein